MTEQDDEAAPEDAAPGETEPPADADPRAADGFEGALEAAEATLSRRPEIDYLLVADRAEVVNGKLYLMGGSWDRITPPQFPHRMLLGIALGVRIPFTFTDEQHTVNVELRHDDRRLVGFAAKLTTGRPPGMAGMDMLVPMAFNVPVAIPSEGQLVLQASVDDRPPRRHEIKALRRPQA